MRYFKFNFLLLVLTGICCSALINIGFAQDSYSFNEALQKKNKVPAFYRQDTKNSRSSLIEELKKLNKEKGVYFIFSDPSLNEKMVNPVSGMKEETNVILDKMLENTGLFYKKINDKTYVILSSKESGDAMPVLHNLSYVNPIYETNAFVMDPAQIINGKVVDQNGTPLPSVSITIKGKSIGTSTNSNGLFSIEASKGDVLVFTSVGFDEKEITIEDNNNISVELTESSTQLSAVVVTALGITRQAKSLTYAVQTVDNAALNNVKDANLINNLTGRVAGLNITPSSSGIGGSARVVIRGNK